MNVVAIIQARTGSTRLPNKIFSELSGHSLLYHVVDRLKPCKEIDEIVIATTTSTRDNSIVEWCNDNYVNYYRGSEENVLKRYYDTAKEFKAEIIIRVTADDPFKDYRAIDKAIKTLKENKYDFVCNNCPVSFPEGLDIEVFTMRTLSNAFLHSTSNFEQEHVTQYIHRNKEKFKIFNIKNDQDLSNIRWTIDTKEDYLFVKEVYNNLYKK
ncbi:glycosyltransferase family protein, partial [Flavobacteriales bacterium]|nr:glycosyltransferase family protein [Flavobacteriales bacterium]